jgi:hypothetical protein
MRPIRKEMVESQLYQLREALGGGRPPVARKQLWVMYSEKNYTGTKFVRDSMNLDLRIRVGLLSLLAFLAGVSLWIGLQGP